MGGTRFVVGALQQILLKRKHAARVALLDAPAAPAGASSGSEGAVAAAAYASASSSLRSSESAEPPTEEQRQAAVAGLAAAAAAPGPPVQQLAAFQQLAGQQLPPGWSWLPDPEVALFTGECLSLLLLSCMCRRPSLGGGGRSAPPCRPPPVCARLPIPRTQPPTCRAWT